LGWFSGSSSSVKAMFRLAVDCIVGNGESILFWKDKWLNGRTIDELVEN
jgi:hypothetical protein